MADSFCRGLRAQHEESAAEDRRPIRAPPVEIARYASPPRPEACSFPIPMIPMLPIFLLFMARDTTGYWQQQVTYRITARLDEPAGVLSGHARITYLNRSPNTLHDFFVHQHLNAFRPGSRGARGDAAGGSISRSGIRRWRSTTASDGRTIRFIRPVSSTASSRRTT